MLFLVISAHVNFYRPYYFLLEIRYCFYERLLLRLLQFADLAFSNFCRAYNERRKGVISFK